LKLERKLLQIVQEGGNPDESLIEINEAQRAQIEQLELDLD